MIAVKGLKRVEFIEEGGDRTLRTPEKFAQCASWQLGFAALQDKQA